MRQYQISDWYQYLMPMLPGITEEFLDVMLNATLREFCEDGRAWTEILGPLSSKADNPKILLDPLPGNTRVGYIYQVTFQTTPNTNKTLTPGASIPYLRPTGDQPTAYFMEGPGVISLNPVPIRDWDDAYFVDASIIPLGPNIRLPEVFWTHWRDAVIDGVCGKCMMMISKPWTNPSVGTMHARKFRNHIKRARAIADGKFTDAQSWAFPDFAKQRIGDSFI